MENMDSLNLNVFEVHFYGISRYFTVYSTPVRYFTVFNGILRNYQALFLSSLSVYRYLDTCALRPILWLVHL